MRARLLLGLLLAGASAALVAQSSTQQDQPRPTFRTEANYVRVDMYATHDGTAIEDLKQEEIEILEDGVPQKMATFEFVKVRPGGAQETRVEPNTVAESRQMAQDPRARVFVIFLDTYHVQVEGSHSMRLPLIKFLDGVLGQDDLVAVMTPEMGASDITFARKTTVISKMMEENWAWGRRERTGDEDPKEQRYQSCYMEYPNIWQEMIDRRREKLSLDALEDLVTYLRGVREERKAVLTVSEGWKIFTANRNLAAGLKDSAGRRSDPDGKQPIYVGPDGKLHQGSDPRNETPGGGNATMAECDADRNALAEMDNGHRFRTMFEQANRANVSFYTIYPRGLAVFDSPIGPRKPPPIAVDIRNLTSRQNTLRELADNTDGIAVGMDTNNLEGAMQRIVRDLTSYYLLGYYSSNSKLDGKFREITVRVKRPEVQVRARRGYRGPTAEELTKATTAEKEKPAAAVSKAFDTVAAISPRNQLRLRTAAWTTNTADEAAAAAVWIVGEVDYRTRKELSWSAGAVADITVVGASGAEVVNKSIELAPGQGTFTLRVPEAGALAPGEYAVRIRVRPTQDGGLPISDTARVIVPAKSERLGEAVMWRRGPTTGPRYTMTADPRFQRSDRIRLEHASTAAGTVTARMLDRAGKPLSVPVQVTEREDTSGEFKWIVADATLAPLAPGDYAVELTLDDTKVVTAFKIVP
jgi:VWFA-related protein